MGIVRGPSLRASRLHIRSFNHSHMAWELLQGSQSLPAVWSQIADTTFSNKDLKLIFVSI